MKGKTPRFDAILWDLDGTLVDSVEDIALAVNHVCARMRRPLLRVETVRGYVGDGIRPLMERVLKTKDADLIEKAIELWRPFYTAHCLDHTFLYPGVLEILNQFKSLSLPMGVVSNKPLAPSETILAGLKIRKIFSFVVGGDSTPKRKPNPEPFLFALQGMKIHSQRVLVVGDSINDIEGARRGGLVSCGVLWGNGSREQILSANPDHLAEFPSEIEKIVRL